MKYLLVAFIAITFLACSQGGSYKKASDAQDAGREFIRASLDGDMKKASFYLLRDSSNIYIFSKFREQYETLPAEEKEAYREAKIRPVKIEKINDSLVHYLYTNSYKKEDTTMLKIVRINDEWLVDMTDLSSKD